MAAILNFHHKAKKQFAFIFLSERFRRNIRTTGYFQINSWQLWKNFLLFKNGGHFEFSKYARSTICFYLLNVRDRTISLKFITHMVCKKSVCDNFPKNYFSTKMAAILSFQIFVEKRKNTFFASILYLLSCAR